MSRFRSPQAKASDVGEVIEADETMSLTFSTSLGSLERA